MSILWVERTPDNAQRIASAITELTGLPEITAEMFMRKDKVYMWGRAPSRVDILTDISGCHFQDAWTNAKRIDYDDVQINVIGLADLIRVKETAGRPQDHLDLENLRKVSL